MKFKPGDKVKYTQEYIELFKKTFPHRDAGEFSAITSEVVSHVHNGVYRLMDRSLIHQYFLEAAQ